MIDDNGDSSKKKFNFAGLLAAAPDCGEGVEKKIAFNMWAGLIGMASYSAQPSAAGGDFKNWVRFNAMFGSAYNLLLHAASASEAQSLTKRLESRLAEYLNEPFWCSNEKRDGSLVGRIALGGGGHLLARNAIKSRKAYQPGAATGALPSLAVLRAAAGIGQSDLAKAAGIHVVTLSNIERGKKEPSILIALALAQLLDTTVEHLMGLKESGEPEPIEPTNARRAAGLTLPELAAKAGMHKAYAAKVCRGEKTPSVSKAAAIAAATGVSVHALAMGISALKIRRAMDAA